MRGGKICLLVGIVILSGCSGFGPAAVSRDRFDYTTAIADSWKHQMLLNMIKIRYGDAPVFLDVSSVISQYQIAGQINLGATINNNPWSSSEILGATGQYVDRPTIRCAMYWGWSTHTFSAPMGTGWASTISRPLGPRIDRCAGG